ncbi:phenylalanine--tRNA ligase subunit beta [Spiroplasma platyhelix]|uniref:Phenylalanine--tRNA ligase beta subunit n=1 Tax=Spiroplasma platyhelix PALS-1 TaxID=1276218 RepID=A0A846U1R2_9MOLU|nr:phenylalanine--tRNA ligase subunit beta [Spiroplasma platyhelix]MBE4704364.1 Phenylalanine--tRNA ligase beta subunit [Spiroplasma platyhelix PALS-1]NKE38736.1 phenylalanine--tRNA ligase subunit beta [Spiroplasma platyhelix PALS-1]UJB28947.1 phenylalanyl-tRNA synthetase subunit beta [Spiroplasma platyhelix PALS-1]
MVVSKRILNQWIDVRKIKDQEIAKALNSLGFEVDKVVNLTTTNTNLIVGEILKIEEHPKSKKLNLCYVNIGRKIVKIICGASNVRVGIKVVVAQVGSKLANDLVIDHREILGVMSHGMICSLSELGLNPEVLSEEELAGIVYLPDDAPVGSLSPLHYLELDDSIFEIQLTLNRSDCLAMYYLAKELSHYFKLPLKKIAVSNFSNIQTSKQSKHEFIHALGTLKINLLNHGQIDESWIKRTLQLTNIKPKSFFDNLVSIVMLELGQPAVVFAADNLEDFKITLANKDYLTKSFQFFKNDIVFSNKEQYFSNLAVSTLSDYFVEPKTKALVFASLNLDGDLVQDQIKRNSFNPSNLFLQRLNKPIVPVNYLLVLQRILFLLHQFHIKFEVVSFVNEVNYQLKDNSRTINYQMINKLLGTNLSLAEIVSALNTIGCKVLKKSKLSGIMKIKIPSYRNDLNNVNDFTEEVARVVGYNNLPKIKPKFVIRAEPLSNLQILLADMKKYLLDYGFHQVKTYNLTNKDTLADFNFFGYKKPITLIAPINLARKAMRFSLLPSLLEICRLNASFKQDSLKVFTDEVIYNNDPEAVEHANHHLAFVVNNDFFDVQNYFNPNSEKSNNYLLIKGFLAAWFTKQGGKEFNDALTYHSFDQETIHPYLSSKIKYNNIHFATIAALHPEIAERIALSKQVFLVEINFTELVAIFAELKDKQVVKYKSWSKFNPLSRDLSIIISSNVEYEDVKNVIWAARTKYLQNLTLIDIYSDEVLKHKKKHSLTFNLEFNSKKEQLDEDRVSQEIKMIQSLMQQRFNAEIR